MVKLQILEPQYFTIGEIKREPEKFFNNPEYQRSEAWKPNKRQNLLESIFKKLSVGILFIRMREDGAFEVLDGQQRIDTIKKFLDNKLSTSDYLMGFKSKKYNDLEKDGQRHDEFLGFKLWYIPVNGGTDEEVADIFIRLQEGQPLNPPEKLNAFQTEMKKFVLETSKHIAFKKIDPWRFSHRYLAAQCTYIYLKSDFKNKDLPNPPRFEDLAEMYKKHTRVSSSIRKSIIGTLDFISKSLQDEIKVIKKKSDFTVLFALAYYVRTNLVVQHEIFRRTITNFITEVENAKTENGEPQNIYEKYKTLRRSGATKENFKIKFELMLKDIEKLEKLVKKDTKRFPTWAQKLKVYYRDNRTCCNCRKHVKFDEISIDHIDQHSKGGPTADIKNLRLVHKGKCHDELEKQKKQKLLSTS